MDDLKKVAGSNPASRELTWSAVVLGLLLSVVMGAANVYLGLRAGMTVSASIPAAVIAMGLYSGVLRRSSVLESNLVQTAASAGESLAAGVIFTMPALVIAGIWETFNYWTVTAIALAGGWLGVLLMVPMRRVFVVSHPELTFPEGLACAEVLKAGDVGEGATDRDRGTRLVFLGVAAGGIVKFLESFLHLALAQLEWAAVAARRVFYVGIDVSPALVSVGVIVGLPIAAQVFLGGAIGWLVTIPLLGAEAGAAGSAVEQAFKLWSEQVRYMGVGAMVVGGIVAIYRVRHGLVAAVDQLLPRSRNRSVALTDPRDRDVSGGVLIASGLAAFAALGAVYFYVLEGAIGLTVITMIVMALMAFFFTAVASYIVGLVGNSNSPVSGMTITAVLATAAMVYLFNYQGQRAMLATLGVAGVVCCVACTAGDVCNDLKTGVLVGASPRNQQIMQLLGVAVGSLVMAPVLTVLHEGSGGIGGATLPAPQATLFATLVDGFFGDQPLPWNMIGWGAVMGIVLVAIDGVFIARGLRARLHVMPVAVGIYLPFGLATAILLGGFISAGLARATNPQRHSVTSSSLAKAVLIASGLIAGEALMGVVLAGLTYFGLGSYSLVDAMTAPALPTVVSFLILAGMVLFVPWLALRAARRSTRGDDTKSM